MKKKKQSIFYKLFFITQVLLLFACYSVYANKWITPAIFPYFGLVSLIFPILFIAYVTLFFLGLFFKRKRNIVFFLLGIPLLSSFFNYYQLPIEKGEKSSHGFTLLTFNVQYGFSGFEELNNYLLAQKADIICLQEIYKRHWRKESLLPERYNAIHNFVGISSKYPIIHNNTLFFPNSNAHGCYADIDLGTDTIRVFNIYLESIYLTNVLDSINNTQDIENSSELITNRLIKGFRTHQWQIEELQLQIKDSPYPVVVAGDFNSVPNSYEYYTMQKLLTDGFTQSGKGMGSTFHNYRYPLRIDYILYDDNFISDNYQIDKEFLFSDHFPVKLNMTLKK